MCPLSHKPVPRRSATNRTVQCVLLALAVMVCISGCKKSDDELRFKLDGKADDWQDVGPLWDEAGLPGRGDFNEIDIRQVRMANDEEYLYIFFHASPSVQQRFAKQQSSGGFCDLYFDSDGDPATGCEGVEGFGYGDIAGYEVRLWITLGTSMSWPSGKSEPFIVYEAQLPGEDGDFASGPEAFHQSNFGDEQGLIAHGPDGVELAVPLSRLGLAAGMTVRMLLAENAHTFQKAGYSERTFTLK